MAAARNWPKFSAEDAKSKTVSEIIKANVGSHVEVTMTDDSAICPWALNKIQKEEHRTINEGSQHFQECLTKLRRSNSLPRVSSISRGNLNLEANSALLSLTDETALQEASLSSALMTVFRGKFCDILLRDRGSTTFDKDEVLYNMGNRDCAFFFIRSGFVKVGTVMADGREIIYDIRKDGDVVGELCAGQSSRRDRAVALERTDAIVVPYAEIIGALQKNPDLLNKLVQIFCDSLSEAYEQINAMTSRDTVPRLINVLLGLASRIGRLDGGDTVQIPTYLTQEEISQMVAARRERVSTALNLLRRRGMVHYTSQGHLLLHVKALENYPA